MNLYINNKMPVANLYINTKKTPTQLEISFLRPQISLGVSGFPSFMGIALDSGHESSLSISNAITFEMLIRRLLSTLDPEYISANGENTGINDLTLAELDEYQDGPYYSI